MKIVICGAGIVGSAIARHLSAEQNDVTVIDIDGQAAKTTEQADVGAVEGMSSYPDILAQAGPERRRIADRSDGIRSNQYGRLSGCPYDF